MPSPSYVPVIPTGRAVTVTDLTATSTVVVDSDGTAINAVDRGATSNYAAYVLRTAGVDRWSVQMIPSSNNLNISDSANGNTPLSITPHATAPTLTVLGLVDITGATASTRILGGLIPTDTVDRYSVRVDGQTEWGAGGASARDTFLRRSAAGVLATDGSFALATAGGGLQIKEGANCTSGTVTLAAGTATISSNKITATSRIQLTVQSLGTVTAPKAMGITARTPGTSATVTSADATDTSVVAWVIVEPAA